MSKFKIGDTIHFMESNKPTSKKIKGLIVVQGEVEFSYNKFKAEEGKTKTVYQVPYTTNVEEENAFGTIEELQTALFNSPTGVEKE